MKRQGKHRTLTAGRSGLKRTARDGFRVAVFGPHPEYRKERIDGWRDEVFVRTAALADAVRKLTTGTRREFDEEYLLKKNYKWMTTGVSEDDRFRVRCDACGRLFWTMPSAIQHVSDHDGEVGEQIDPFEEGETLSPFGGVVDDD